MSVLAYLNTIESNVKLDKDTERDGINRSVNTLKSRLSEYFDDEISLVTVFGSYDRDTLLSRYYDAKSDVDVMVRFQNSDYRPQTYLDKLKRFAERKYLSSQNEQSSPAIVLNLNHIRFELVPSIYQYYAERIPAPANNYQDWISTDPSKIKNDLDSHNRSHKYITKRLVRLLKYWNIKQGRIYSSFELETHIVSHYYFPDNNLKELFYRAIDYLPLYNLPTYKQQRVKSTKRIVKEAKEYEDQNFPYLAESKIATLFL
ncbi:SMODS domain-containing nucleotidyltransferase [Neolewinella litorea]|uniref:Nucleotidyltransferase n=1 Tax=Neolewinella litorea TaxID=2562452 RepID=A0A4S4NE58_9BACT|nr:nucleotidyltransferase domain-containing protein [Neolewinella litorea]THH37816.1 nucleotidyltransferase [Neolewinella litorea]